MSVRTTRATLLATTFAVALGSVASAAPELVVNGGFEGVGFSPWVSGGSGLNTVSNNLPISQTQSFRGACAGVACLAVGPASVTGTGTVTQNIVLQPGVYRLVYSVQNDSATGIHQFAAGLGNAVVHSDTALAAGTFGFTRIVTASGGSTGLVFGIRHDPAAMRVDNVSLQMVDDGAGNNLGAAAQTVAAGASRNFMDRIFDRYGHAAAAMQLAAGSAPVMVASSDGAMYVGRNNHYRGWVAAYGDQSRWDSGDVRAHRRGLSFGADYSPTANWNLGLGVSLGNSEFKTRTAFTGNRGEADERQIAAFIHYAPSSLPLYATAVAGYGQSRNDFSRNSLVGLGSVHARDVDSTQWFGALEAGYDWKAMSSLTLTPFARIEGARLEQDAYAEIASLGSTLVPAAVGSVDQDAARSILGLRASTEFSLGSFKPKVNAKAGWAHEFERNRSVSFTESTFGVNFNGTASGATPVANSAVAGAGIEVPITENASFYAGYNGDYGSGQTVHTGEVGFRVTW